MPTGVQAQFRRLGSGYLLVLVLLCLGLHLCWGSSGWRWPAWMSADPIFWQIRLPRSLTALSCGGLLALSGLLLQTLFRNPLADPGLMGTSSGASLGVALLWLLGWEQPGPLMFGALLGALSASVCLLLSMRAQPEQSVQNLLLVGVSLNLLFGSLVQGVQWLFPERQLKGFLSWGMGNLDSSSLILALPCAALTVVLAGLWLRRGARALDTLWLGESEAHLLGLNTTRMRWLIIVSASIGVAASVLLAGSLGFVGLLAPALARLLTGARHQHSLPSAWACGVILLSLADTLGQHLSPQTDIPVGLMLSWLGAPTLLWMLWRQRWHAI